MPNISIYENGEQRCTIYVERENLHLAIPKIDEQIEYEYFKQNDLGDFVTIKSCKTVRQIVKVYNSIDCELNFKIAVE